MEPPSAGGPYGQQQHSPQRGRRAVPQQPPVPQMYTPSGQPSPARPQAQAHPQALQQPGQHQQQHQQQQQQPPMGGFFHDPQAAFLAGTMGTAAMQLVGGSSQLQSFQNVGQNLSSNVGHLKYYFAVDTKYVLKKLQLVLFPFLPHSWARADNNQLPPREDVNAPDLYIPTMALITYVLVAGVALGASGNFSPEGLGMAASSTFLWLLLEVVLAYAGVYLLSVSGLGWFELAAYCSYKYVGMTLALLSFLVLQSYNVYVFLLLATAVSLVYFLVQTIRHRGGGADDFSAPISVGGSISVQKQVYFLLGLTAMQVLIMYWFTSSFVSQMSAAGARPLREHLQSASFQHRGPAE